ncbi:MAG TPA: PEGA domain-containing protein [Myxococcota bacterium]|nr:PEGA domain-containing protein [Myxococcota bacterium]
MLRTFTFSILLAVLITPAAPAQENPGDTLAVFAIDNRGPRMSRRAVENLGEYLSVLLGESGMRVLDRDQVRTQIGKGSCGDHACRVKVARKLGATRYLSARILKIVNTCKVTAKLYALDQDIPLRSASAGQGCDEKDLLDALREIVFKLAYVQTGTGPVRRIVPSADVRLQKNKTEIGRLSLNSRPWGRVWIDGKDIGSNTPLVDYLLPAGKHAVIVYPPTSKKMQASVEIRPGETTSLVLLPDKLPADKTASGWLTVNTRPWSEVAVDGEHIGMTPLRRKLAPGQHEVKVSYGHGESKTVQVKVEAGKTMRVVLNASGAGELGKGKGLLMVNSLPWGRVWIDGSDSGKATPLMDLKLDVGQHRVTVYFSTGGTQTKTIEIKEGESSRLVFRGD